MQKRPILISIIAALAILGGIMKILFSFPIDSLYLAIQKGGTVKNEEVTIVKVAPNSPAELANIHVGDVLVSVNSKTVSSVEDFSEEVRANRGKLISVVFIRNGNQKSVELTPRVDPLKGEGSTGVELVNGINIEPKPI